MNRDETGEPLLCSFGGRSSEEATLMSRANTPPSRAYICEDCIRALYEILQQEERLSTVGESNRATETSDAPDAPGMPGSILIPSDPSARFVGVELYFEDLDRAKNFYIETLGLKVSDEQIGRYAKFESDAGFICLERKGSETYPSQDKAVLFFEVPDLEAAIMTIGKEKVVRSESGWAVLHDPEGHNILLLQAGSK